MTFTVRSFVDDDAEYLLWLGANPDGFVLNTDRRATAKYVVLHCAACRSISGTPARGKSWTVDYAKHCAATTAELTAWSSSTVGVEPARCKLCNP